MFNGFHSCATAAERRHRHLDEPDNLLTCLAALDAQRAEGIPFEIIVVDNGSVEDPEAVCSQVEGVRLEREPNPGPGPETYARIGCRVSATGGSTSNA
ncbi:glycosyltransferase family 2 protein [Sinorhizobium meliloti]|nr:glycosyltransferase family 2 protein [Sinorhizobium meliloti]